MNKSGYLTLEEVDEKQFDKKPWARELLESTSDIVRKGVLNWCNIISKIGEDEVNVEQYVEIFKNQVSKLIMEMVEDVDCIQEKSLNRIEKLLEDMSTLCKELSIDIPTLPDYDKLPLSDLRKGLIQKIEELEASAGVRRREIRELSQKHVKLCQSLGKNFLPITESPLPSAEQLEHIRNTIDSLETEAMEREEKFFQLRDEIMETAHNFKILPSLDFERATLELGPNDVRITCSEMKQLEIYRDKLRVQSKQILEELAELRVKVDDLWTKLEVDITERDAFINMNCNNDTNTLEAFKKELDRLDQLKRANLQKFILKQREELQDLWKRCHCSKEDIESFSFYYDHETYNEDLFELHDMEIRKWQNYYSDNVHIFELLEEHKRLWQQQQSLELKAGGADRYKNRGGQLLNEEKARNRLKKKIPKLEDELSEMADSYLSHNGKHFRTYGETIQHYLSALHEEADKQFKLKLSAKKMEREQSTITSSSKKNLFSASKMAGTSTLKNQNVKRKLLTTPSTEPMKKVVKVSARKLAANTGKLPKFNTSLTKRRSSGRLPRKKLTFTSANKENQGNISSTDYDEFEHAVSKKPKCRSTTFVLGEQEGNETVQARPDFHCIVTTPSKTEKVLVPRQGTFVFKTPLRKH